MALTPEQKAANKLATKAKDAAFRARRKLFEETKAARLAQFEQKNPGLAEARVRTEAASNAAMAARDRESAEIRAQIAALQQSLETLSAKYNIEALALARREASANYFSAKRQVEHAVDEEFPDIADCFYRSEWERRCQELGLPIK